MKNFLGIQKRDFESVTLNEPSVFKMLSLTLVWDIFCMWLYVLRTQWGNTVGIDNKRNRNFILFLMWPPSHPPPPHPHPPVILPLSPHPKLFVWGYNCFYVVPLTVCYVLVYLAGVSNKRSLLTILVSPWKHLLWTITRSYLWGSSADIGLQLGKACYPCSR